MKRITLLISVCFGITSAFGQLIGNESFNYTSGGGLIGNGTWIDAARGTGAAAGPTITTPNLSYAGLLTSGGTAASFGAGNENTMMNLSGGGTGTWPGGSPLTVYFSYLLQLSSAASTGPFEITGLDQRAVSPIGSRGLGVMVQDNGSGTGFYIGFIRGGQNGTTLANTSVIHWIGGATGIDPAGSTVFNYGTTLFVVGGYNFTDPPKNPTSSDNDTASFWVNPASATLGAASAPTADVSGISDEGHAALDLANIASFDLIQNDAFGNARPTGFIDDVRVGYSWADVTPAVPEPSMLALGALGLGGLVLVRRFRRR